MLIEVDRIVDTRSPVEALWPLVTDTERINRAIGLERVDYRPLASAGAARFLGTTQLGGFSIEYEELPTQWREGKFFHIARRLRSGPVTRIEVRFEFTAREPGGQVRVTMRLETPWRLLSPLVRLRARQSIDRMASEIQRLDRAAESGRRPSPMPPVGGVSEVALAAALRALEARTVPAGLAQRLGAWVREADDVEVARMRPYALADEWEVERRELLTAMLEGVKAGLLELSWEVICPSCRAPTAEVSSLSLLSEHGQCQLCELDFGLDVDEAIEATFSPARAVRRVVEGTYCLAGPARVPHVIEQAIVPARGEVTLTAPTAPGRYRLFVRGGAVAQVVVAAGEQAEASLDADALPEQLSLAPGASVRLRNASGDERHAKVERSAWGQQAVSVREMSTLPSFRREFSADLLRPGVSIKVARVALFFSDLTGSTQLYSQVGDAAAFRLVHDHFDLVVRLIEQHGGAMVKTIGDAVMASFTDELAAVTASLEILRAFEDFRGENEHRALTHIKLGVYAGSCYVVTANGILDYFGQTVNLAARLQGQADSGELVVTSALAHEAIRQGLVGADALRQVRAASLKGVGEAVEVAHLAIP